MAYGFKGLSPLDPLKNVILSNPYPCPSTSSQYCAYGLEADTMQWWTSGIGTEFRGQEIYWELNLVKDTSRYWGAGQGKSQTTPPVCQSTGACSKDHPSCKPCVGQEWHAWSPCGAVISNTSFQGRVWPWLES